MIDQIKITSIGMPKDLLKGKDALGQRIFKPALLAGAEHWVDSMLPRHFEPHAANRYHYQQRKPGTIRKKSRQAARFPDARLPLVFSGKLRREISRMARYSGSNRKVTAYLSGPRYVHMYSKGDNHPFLAGELTTTTNAERQELAKVSENEAIRLLNSDKTKSVRTVR